MAHVNMPNVRPPEDALSLIARGLGIARDVYSIKTDMAKLDRYRKEQEESKALSEGRYNKAQQVELSNKFNVSSKKPENGPYQEIFDYETGEPLYATAIGKESSPLQTTIKSMKDGKRIETIYDTRTLSATKDPKKAFIGSFEIGEADIPPAEARRRKDREEDKLDKKVEALGKDASGFKSLFLSINNIENDLGFNLDDFDPKTGTVNGKSVDVPGVSLPLLGRTSFYSSPSRQLDSSISRIFNLTLKDRSGSAVTTQELERLKNEFSSGRFNSEKELIGALKRYKEEAEALLKESESRYESDVKEEYKRRGGFTSDQFKKKVSSEAPMPKEGDIDTLGGVKYRFTNGRYVEMR